jgi:hypothetical protein
VTPPKTASGFESPSLDSSGGGDGPAYELKFLLEEDRAQEVAAWARSRLILDPHGDPALGGAYRTTSLYCDTPELDVYHRSPSYRRRKYRVRRYGTAAWIFLERKSKWGDRVEKQRSPVQEDELQRLAAAVPEATWSGEWFHSSLLTQGLHPACRIAYDRTAFVGSCPDGPLRLTLDRRVHGILTNEWGIQAFDSGRPLLTGQIILEFKFRSALPAPFKELVHDMRLSTSAVSKYRLCREAWGVPAPSAIVRETADA